MRLESVIGKASDRLLAQLGQVSANVARLEKAKDASPILMARLLAHQAQLLEQQRNLEAVKASMRPRS
jgi:hypothetical protein